MLKAFWIIYFSLWWTKQLSQKHHSFVKWCQNAKSGYRKEGVPTGYYYFLGKNIFYVGFKIIFLEILNKEIKNIFLKQLQHFCLFLEGVHLPTIFKIKKTLRGFWYSLLEILMAWKRTAYFENVLMYIWANDRWKKSSILSLYSDLNTMYTENFILASFVDLVKFRTFQALLQHDSYDFDIIFSCFIYTTKFVKSQNRFLYCFN